MRYYYADTQNQPVGPFAKGDLEKMMSAGVVDPETFVCPEGGLEWITLSSLIPGSLSNVLAAPPAQKVPIKVKAYARVEKNAATIAAASILFPVIAIILNLIDAAVPMMFAPGRSIGKLLIFFLIGLLGALNARSLLKIPGIAHRELVAVKLAKVGLILFALSVLLLILLAGGF